MNAALYRKGDLALIVRGTHSFPPIPRVIEMIDSVRGMATLTMSFSGKEFPFEIPLENIETDARKFGRIVKRILKKSFFRDREQVLESYFATGRLRGFPQELLDAWVDRYDDRCEVIGTIFAMDNAGIWKPSKTTKRLLDEREWKQLNEWVVISEFWQLLECDGVACLDSEHGTIEGFRDGRYHSLARMSGGSDGAIVIGHRLAQLAKVWPFDDADEG